MQNFLTQEFPHERFPGLSENPLLPHSKLRELHALILRTRTLERKQARKQKTSAAREALLAATTLQLLPGDLLSAEPGDVTAGHLAPVARRPGAQGGVIRAVGFEARLPLCAAAARG
ncbi:MAG: hypothetical protein WBY53_11850, partial [Acidobacteriaceae bacterium]